MAESDDKDKPRPKSGWDKLDIILRPVGGLLTALSVALVGILGSNALEQSRNQESNVQLYAQLMSSREASDSALRRGMFDTIMSRFLSPDSDPLPPTDTSPHAMKTSYERDVLRLEMLAYNFNDSLDLSPLFKDVHRKLADADLPQNRGITAADRHALLKRLERLASDITEKQVSTLDEGTNVARRNFGFDELHGKGSINILSSKKLSYQDGDDTKSKYFSVDVYSVDREKKSVNVHLTVWDATGSESAFNPDVDVTFNVGFFDFPLIDNTRLHGGERCALVLTNFDDVGVHLALVFFPGSRASLKDKQFYDNIVQELHTTPGVMSAGNHGSTGSGT